MSQLNLKQLLGTDDVAVIVDKLNYNFNQIILNGGGPQGRRGLIGSPGFPGLQGERGLTGSTGEDGTHWFVAQMGPTAYTFGGTYSDVPRIDDLYMNAQPTFIDIYQYTLGTGGTGAYWNLIDTLQSPSGALKLIYDAVQVGATYTALGNDPTISSKLVIGTPEAMGASGFILNPLDPTKLVPELSTGIPFYDSLVTLASRTGNQLRLIGIDDSLLDGTRVQHGGGIEHSFLYTAGNQLYRIQNADILGEKAFSLNLNSGLGTSLFYGSTANMLSIGGSEFEPLVARLSVNSTLAVGSPSFYQNVTMVPGGIIQGSLMTGDNYFNTWFSTGNGIGNFSDNGRSANIWIDSQTHPGNSNAGSNFTMSTNIGSSVFSGSSWKWSMSAYNNAVNKDQNNLKLTASVLPVNGGLFGTPYVAMYKSLTAESFNTNVRPAFGIGNLNNKLPTSWLEVGHEQTLGLGHVYGYSGMGGYFSFNLHRKAFTNGPWITRGYNGFNGGMALWGNVDGGLAVSMIGTNGGTDQTNGDSAVWNHTRLSLNTSGWLTTTDQSVSEAYKSVTPLHIAYNPQGSPSDGTNANSTSWRRQIALFGGGRIFNTYGSPLICALNSLGQNLNVAGILPQYTFWKSDLEGFYLDQASTTNGASGNSVGIVTQKQAAVTVVNGGDPSHRGPWVGIYNRNPYGRLHVGASAGGPGILISDMVPFVGGQMQSSEILYNAFRDTTNGLQLQQGSDTTRRGFAQIAFRDENIASNARRAGTTITLRSGWAGATGFPFYDIMAFFSGQMPAMFIAPPAFRDDNGGAFATGFNSNMYPQVRIGMMSDSDNSNVLKRGTLSIPAQSRNNLIDVEDIYNIGLYSEDQTPVIGLGVGSNGTSNHPQIVGDRAFRMSFLRSTGSIGNDIPILQANVSSATSTSNLNNRLLWTGEAFRIVMGSTPSGSMLASNAKLYVQGFTGDGTLGTRRISGYFEDNLVVDHTAQWSTGAGGIQIRNNSVSSNPWQIGYENSGFRKGLNFYKPGTNVPYGLWLDDGGGVIMGAMQGEPLPQNKDFFGNYYYMSKVGAPFPGWNDLFNAGPPWVPTWPATNWYKADPNPGGDGGSANVGGITLSVRHGIRADAIVITSDKRLKIEDSKIQDDGLKIVERLNPIRFRWKKDGSPSAGFYAQELGELIPESVLVFGEGDNETMTVNYNVVVPYLAAAIKTLNEKIIEKNKKIEELESRLSKIEKLLNL